MGKAHPRFCPVCGSARPRPAPLADNRMVLVRDRLCPDCGARYTPAVPLWQALLMFPLGLIGMGAGLALLYHYFLADHPPGTMVVNPFFSLVLVVAGGAGLVHGCVGLFRRSPQVVQGGP